MKQEVVKYMCLSTEIYYFDKEFSRHVSYWYTYTGCNKILTELIKTK